MGEDKFDEVSKGLARPISRRRAAKLFATAAAGSVATLAGARGVFADDPGRCRKVGTICRRSSECCSGFCHPTKGRCACPGGTHLCSSSGQCISCASGLQFNPTTCKCQCPTNCSANPCGVNPFTACGQSPTFGTCLCSETVSGGCRCFQPICLGTPQLCDANNPSCPSGFACVNSQCCGFSFCAALCGTTITQAGSAKTDAAHLWS
jgi:hypothetical protein